MSVPLVLLCGVFGLLIGSFLNVVIYRVPRGESVVRPGSRCPGCGHELSWYENVPLVSWLVLRGRCRSCHTPISARYPLVELLTGILFGAMAWRFGAAWELPAFLYLAAISVALSFIDIDTQRLPDVIVLPSYVVAAVLLGLAALIEPDWSSFLRAVLGGAALLAFYFLALVIYPRGMGWGDVKLAGVVGAYLAWISWGALAVGAFAGFLLGGLFGALLMAVRRAGRKTKIPFGPWLLLGVMVGVLWGTDIAHWYTDTFVG
jgi:leader peptidase (prepilin peptidase)/N-methyltransferase